MVCILPRHKQLSVLHHLVEGNTLRSTTRLTGVHRSTIMTLLLRLGEGCQQLMDERFVGLTLDHLEVDEIWTFCAKKQARLSIIEKEERHDIGDIYLWTAVDQSTKLVPAFVVGKRSADNARKLMRQLAGRLVFPNAHQSDSHAFAKGGFDPITQISTDMLAAYPEAVDQFFGPYARYGQIQKEYRNAKLMYDPSQMIGTKRVGIRGIDDYRSICTSHVERLNGTQRLFMKRLNRLTYAFSKKLENLEAAFAMFAAYYNYCWQTRHSDRSGKSGTKRPSAAMMAGLTGHVWSFDELFDEVLKLSPQL